MDEQAERSDFLGYAQRVQRIGWGVALSVGVLLGIASPMAWAAGWLLGAAGGMVAFRLLVRQTEQRGHGGGNARRDALLRLAVRGVAFAVVILWFPTGLWAGVAGLFLPQGVLLFTR